MQVTIYDNIAEGKKSGRTELKCCENAASPASQEREG